MKIKKQLKEIYKEMVIQTALLLKIEEHLKPPMKDTSDKFLDGNDISETKNG